MNKLVKEEPIYKITLVFGATDPVRGANILDKLGDYLDEVVGTDWMGTGEPFGSSTVTEDKSKN